MAGVIDSVKDMSRGAGQALKAAFVDFPGVY